jgi:hypothetical protein
MWHPATETERKTTGQPGRGFRFRPFRLFQARPPGPFQPETSFRYLSLTPQCLGRGSVVS